jgi:hypothetical protein
LSQPATASPAVWLAFSALVLSCADREPGSGAVAPGSIARGVTVDVPAGDATLVVRGDRLELRDGGTDLVLKGDVRLEIDGSSRLEARADRLRLEADGPVVEMAGNVRAAFSAPLEGADDAGP